MATPNSNNPFFSPSASTAANATTATTGAMNNSSNSTSNHVNQAQTATPPASDPFVTNDYFPIQQANKAIIQVLRSDELSSNGDLYKRIASSSTNASNYKLDGCGGSSAASSNVAGIGNGDVGNGSNGSNGHAANGHAANGHGAMNGNASGMRMNGSNGFASSNNLNEMNNSNNSSNSNNMHSTFKYTNSIPLPSYITQEQKQTKISSLMGILPHANMVWVSVDDALYLWEYGSGVGVSSSRVGVSNSGGGEGSDDFVCFKVPSGQCVVSVGLVKPKQGVFKDIVEWCLVVTTHEEAIICALTRESMSSTTTNGTANHQHHSQQQQYQSDTHLKLIPTRYIIPTDSVPMLSICGTDDGRIFMGGYDGCLYEMSYEGVVQPAYANTATTTTTNGYDMYDTYGEYNDSVVDTIASGSKRALSTLLFGPSSSSANVLSSSSATTATIGFNRPRKCRKVNHTSTAPQIVSAFVPRFVINAASYMFGGSNSSYKAGPIVKLILDHDRKTMYALTSKGFIHAFDLNVDSVKHAGGTSGTHSSNDGSGSGGGGNNSAPKLACTVDVAKSVRKYLDCVAHGKTYASSMTSSDISIAAIHFPGGGTVAQTGIGGMEGARSILKIADSEMERKKQMRQQALSAASSSRHKRKTKFGTARNILIGDGCLHPNSIHIIPPSESSFLTLVAVSSAGLRYYLSVLPDVGTSRYGNTSVKPGRRFSLCHIRALPPLSINIDNDVMMEDGPSSSRDVNGAEFGVSPSLTSKNRMINFEVKNACYIAGSTLLALSNSQSGATENIISKSGQRAVGDSILVITPDYTSHGPRVSPQNSLSHTSYADTSSQLGSKGLSEIVSQPIFKAKYGTAVMAGGHVWDLATIKQCMTDDVSLSVLNLHYNSTTPPDSILENEILPPFIPRTMLSHSSKSLGNGKNVLGNSTSLQTANRVNQQKGIKTGYFNGVALLWNIVRSVMSSNSASSSRREGRVPTYRITDQDACKAGFSSSALEKIKYGRKSTSVSRTNQSRRLQQVILKPAIMPLPEMSMQHLSSKVKQQGLIALNATGVHYFSEISPIEKLKGFLMESSSSNVGKDEQIKTFFSKYGHEESIALCLSIAIESETSESLEKKAIQVALNCSTRPRLTANGNQAFSNILSSSIIPGFEDYLLQSSTLHNGLQALIARLLRPIWCKPAVVVTEGKIVVSKKTNKTRIIPAKVELLLDEATLESIKRPLLRLQRLMKDLFQPAVNTVPRSKTHLSDNTMDTDGGDTSASRQNLMTSAVQYREQTSSQMRNLENTQYNEKELLSAARLHEERNIHAFYRTISRTVQALNLMSHLRRAHNNPDLPEVDFGYLHSLTYSQLVTLQKAQERIDTLLTNLFTDKTSSFLEGSGETLSSVESNNLASTLSNDCYLFFSIGSRLTHLGFSHAQSAASHQPYTKLRADFTSLASSYLQQAAYHWHNPILISGGISPNSSSTPEELATSALQAGSPLARAASVLMLLGDVIGVVNVCLICARNFGGVLAENLLGNYDSEIKFGSMMSWERGLYHRPLMGKTEGDGNSQMKLTSSSTAVILANSDTDNRKDEAKQICHSVLFSCLGSLLLSSHENEQNHELAKEMVSVATDSTDFNFLKELYGYLANSGHVETLLKINNSSVESWLENVNEDPELLWRYYVFHGFYWLAGQYMWGRGSTTEKTLNVNDRILCLDRALTSYLEAIQKYPQNASFMADLPTKDELERCVVQIQEQIDVAKLQSRILTAIKSSQNASDVNKSKLQDLSFSLINVSTLYNDFAAPLALYDLCLAIMQTCNCDDTSTIRTLWRSILCEELLPCRTQSEEVQFFLNTLQRGSMFENQQVLLTDSNVTNENGDSLMLFEDGDWIFSIKNRIITLGKELQGKGADFVFPVSFICEQLEGLNSILKNVSDKAFDQWTVQTFIDSGTSFPSLFEAYHFLITSQDVNAPKNTTQIWCICRVLKQWLSSITVFGENRDLSVQLKRYTPIIMQHLDSYKSRLESVVDSREVLQLREVLSGIEDSLRRHNS